MSKAVWGKVTLTIGNKAQRIGWTCLDVDELQALLGYAAEQFLTTPPPSAASPASSCASAPAPTKTNGRATWLTAFDDAWHATFKAHLNFGQAARELAPLVKEHGLELTLAYFRSYLQRQEPRFASIAHFSRTFAVWAPGRAGADKGTIKAGRSLLERWKGEGKL